MRFYIRPIAIEQKHLITMIWVLRSLELDAGVFLRFVIEHQIFARALKGFRVRRRYGASRTPLFSMNLSYIVKFWAYRGIGYDIVLAEDLYTHCEHERAALVFARRVNTDGASIVLQNSFANGEAHSQVLKACI